ncbi:MAG: nucleotide-binding protein [Betaproteobacteria bacterium]|nr:nucleotide-binding protein [Betaproteobacteria bacterium]
MGRKKLVVPIKPAGNESTVRKNLLQTDVPSYSLAEAIRVPQAIADSYGKNPTKPLRVAEGMNLSPGSSFFRVLTGTAIAYGLTEGGYNSDVIAITPLGRRIVAPTKEGDDLAAKREALMRPRIIRDFLTRYNESRLPTAAIGKNVLEELGVPADRAPAVFELIVDTARSLGVLRELKGQAYVDLGMDGSAPPAKIVGEGKVIEDDDTVEATGAVTPAATPDGTREGTEPARRRTGRVFITHGKNKDIVSQLKDLLAFGGFTPVVAIEQETVSKPVPDKVLDDMRSCDAAIIHVGTDLKLLDSAGKEHKMLNQNVLIEIGAAMALYGRKFILLVENGATLPSNLQGLYEVRYEGEKLDYESTMKLLKAFADFRG